jgi:hypothetical protein
MSLEARVQKVMEEERAGKDEVVEDLGGGGGGAAGGGAARKRRVVHELPWKTLHRIARSDPQTEKMQLGSEAMTVLERAARLFLRDVSVRAGWMADVRTASDRRGADGGFVVDVDDVVNAVHACHDGRFDFLLDVLPAPDPSSTLPASLHAASGAAKGGRGEEEGEEEEEEEEEDERSRRRRQRQRRARRKRQRGGDDGDDEGEEETEAL